MAPSTANNMTMKRIHREIKDLEKEDMGGMTLTPSENNLFSWRASIPGPEGSPYEGGVFNLQVELANDYPFSAPKVTFATRIYHMNISDRGSVCIDILKHNWSPALSLYKVLLSLSSLLTDPNPKDPLVPTIATEFSRNRKKHDSTARQWTKLYAHPPVLAEAAQSTSNKGKAKAVAAAAPPPQPSATTSVSSIPPAQTQHPPPPPPHQRVSLGIVELDIDSDDSDVRAAVGRKRKRTAADRTEEQQVARRRRTDGPSQDTHTQRVPEVIVIDD